MYLTPREIERLLLFQAAELARRRRERGLKLTYPEAYAIIADAICEGARDGRSVAELMSLGATVLTLDDVEAGVELLLDTLMVEAMFPDGQKLVCVHDPIRAGTRAPEASGPGSVHLGECDIELNEKAVPIRLVVRNTGDRAVQVGSHYHFFETNPALSFERARAFGTRLNIPAGTAVRFEPGDEREIELIPLGGKGIVRGLAGLTDGETQSPEARSQALTKARESGYLMEG